MVEAAISLGVGRGGGGVRKVRGELRAGGERRGACLDRLGRGERLERHLRFAMVLGRKSSSTPCMRDK